VPDPQRAARRLPAARRALRAAAAATTLLCFASCAEGVASLVHVADAVLERLQQPRLARYDAELGWVSAPSLALPDAWGSHRGLHINSRGFRGRAELTDETAFGTSRALCSGDSFTFGEGVSDEATWCAQLSQLEPRLETVNLGEPGYSAAQSYLRYRRDAQDLAHDLHLFAFIGDDLRRVGLPVQYGYARPQLRAEGDGLAPAITRVPYWRPTLARMAGELAQQLRSVELARRALDRFAGGWRAAPEPSVAELAPLLRRVFEAVARLGERRGARTVFVYLPTQVDLEGEQPWRGWARAALAELGFPLVDLTDALRALPRASALASFIPAGALAASHYTELGHAWVARELHTQLRAQWPELLSGAPCSGAGEARC
jgi:hypothetical protein